jgi:hypothetical protein
VVGARAEEYGCVCVGLAREDRELRVIVWSDRVAERSGRGGGAESLV